ncbi:MAG: hypothetical protein JEY99_08125 [Spirochaetales bacterium]|nr:hypothetical protein [Spirochaetales bacterium]
MKLFERSLFLLLFFISLFSLSAYDYIEDPLVINSSRSKGMGGAHAADTHDMAILFANPGGFQAVDTEMAFAEITLGLKGPVFDIADVVVNSLNSDAGMEDMIAQDSTLDLLSGIYAGLSLTGPIYFGYVGNGLGLGFFQNTDVIIKESAPLTLEATVREDIILCGGYTYRLPFPESWNQNLDLGLMLKGGVRGDISITAAYLELMSLDFGTDMLMQSPFDFIAGIGFDIGALYSFRDIFSIGLTCLDIFTPTTKKSYTGLEAMIDGSSDPVETLNGVVPMTLNAGISFTPPLGLFDKYISNLVFLVDYKDILGFWFYDESYLNPWLHLSGGAEITLLDIFSLRCGLDKGLFSAGLSTDLTIFNMNIALFGSELGSEPGVNPIYNLMIGLEFRI